MLIRNTIIFFNYSNIVFLLTNMNFCDMILKYLLCICHVIGKVWVQYTSNNNIILKFQMLYEPSELIKNNFTFYSCISFLVISVNKTVLSNNNSAKNNVITHIYIDYLPIWFYSVINLQIKIWWVEHYYDSYFYHDFY